MKRILINNNHEFYSDDYELVSILEPYIGYEAKLALDEVVALTDYNKIKSNTDLDCYESQLDENRCAFLDIESILLSIKNEMEESRTNKQKVLKLIESAMKEISNAI